MRKSVALLALLSLSVAAFLFYSCNKVTDSKLATGNPADPAFVEVNLAMQQSAENSQDAVFDGIDYMFSYLSSPPQAAEVNTESLIYAWENGWHHLIVNHINDTTGSSSAPTMAVEVMSPLFQSSGVVSPGSMPTAS